MQQVAFATGKLWTSAPTVVMPLKAPGPLSFRDRAFAPDDGFSAYAPFATRGAARWGDYSAAVADEFGNIWMGAEMIPHNPPRFILAGNRGAFITAIAP